MLKKEIVLSEVKEKIKKVNELLETINEPAIDLKQSREKLGKSFGEGVDLLVENGVMPEPDIVNYYNRIFADDAVDDEPEPEPEPVEEEEEPEVAGGDEDLEEEVEPDDEDELDDLEEVDDELEEVGEDSEPDELSDDDLTELEEEDDLEELEEEDEPKPKPKPEKKPKPKKGKGKSKPKTKQPEKEASMEASVEVLKGLTTKKAIKEYCKKHLPDVEIKFLTKDTVAQMKAKVVKAMKKPVGKEEPTEKPKKSTKNKAKGGKKPTQKPKKTASGATKKGKTTKGKGKGAPKSKPTGKTTLSGTDCFGFKIGGKTHQFAMLIAEGPRTMAAVAKEGVGTHPKALKKMIETGMMKRDKSGVISLTAPGKKKYTAFKKEMK